MFIETFKKIKIKVTFKRIITFKSQNTDEKKNPDIFKSGDGRRFNKHKGSTQMRPEEEMPSDVNPFRQQPGSAG